MKLLQKLKPVINLFFIVTILITFFQADKGWTQDNKAEINKLFEQAWGLFTQMHKDISSLDKAIAVYKKALEIDPKNPDVYWKLAEVTFKKADDLKNKEEKKKLFDETMAFAMKALELNPNSLEGHYWVGCSAIRLAQLTGVFSAVKMVNQAKKELLKTIEINPNHRFSTLAMTVLAAIYREAPWPIKDINKAYEYAEKAVKQDPNLIFASRQMAYVYIEKKEFEKARKELNRSLSVKNPTYIWDAELYDWPKAKETLKSIEGK
ncbi:MAG: tetratricopeptide repeat protein [Desulfobacterales bacterium]|nr:tetratricopeptide repeat protein [Desulfobacterales bacterium]MBF0395707.1 tetratricopeptide repeat protein [Desulfobacterales bacterium]